MPRPKLLIYSFIILLFFHFSCTERLDLDIDRDLSILVVDGRITDADGPYEVRLFRTVDLTKTDEAEPEMGAIITIYDDKGHSDTFNEISPGVYHNISKDFKGLIGRSYWIEIQTSDEKKYESTPEMIPPKITVESIYGEKTKVLQDNGKYLKGIGFYLHAKSHSNESSYMRWTYKESWEWHSPFDLPKTDNPSQICYPYNTPFYVSINDGSKRENKEFKHLATSFINENEVKLNYNYFLDINLYSISKRNYLFWESIKKSINNGGIYDFIPSSSEGNICACDDNESVIGYFESSSVCHTTKTFTIDDFEMNFPDFPPDCEEIKLKIIGGQIDEKIYHYINDYINGTAHIFVVKYNYCYDCNSAYSPVKPPFWH